MQYYFSLSLLHNNYFNLIKKNGITSQLSWLPKYGTTGRFFNYSSIGTISQINKYYWPNK